MYTLTIIKLFMLSTGFLVEFISMPVTCGFTSAAAVTIAVSQIKSLLGLPGKADGFINCLVHLFNNIKLFRPGDTALGLCTIVVLIVLKVFVLIYLRFLIHL